MPLDPGTRLGPYEIVEPLGQGGMGEVYRARDSRLGRDVAIKVLPHHLSEQPEIRSRFEREAKTVSSLNHPNICVLFDVGRAPREGGGEIDYLVMELVEGETLAQRLGRGPLSNQDLLRFGTQIADALDRAHRAGVIHRDLKPGNVMITKSGAKLMDFGLARVTGLAPGGGSGSSGAAMSQSPTIAQALTAEGSLLGTFQYMSPEQLEGREADTRSDIWALGCVLYEMVTGHRAFEGRSQASLIAAILEREPAPVGETPSGAVSVAGAPPHGIERLIRNCLAKDPEERVQTAHDVKLQLQGIAEGAGIAPISVASAPAVALPAQRARGGSKLAWGIAALGLVAAAGIFAWLWPQKQVRSGSLRFDVRPPAGVVDMYWPRISPDGRFLMVVTADSSLKTHVMVRRMDQTEFHPVPGTEGVMRAYWSPDGNEIALVINNKIQRVSLAGGSPVTVCPAPGGADLSWGSKGQILMDGSVTDSLRVVPAGGGELRPATRIDRAADEIGAGWPSFLPDGEHFLFKGNQSSRIGGNIRLGRLGTLDSKLLGQSDGRVEYAPGGWVLFVRGNSLLAQKLDINAGKLTGQPITVCDALRLGDSQGHFSISNGGILAFSPQAGAGGRTIHIADRSGTMQPTLFGGPVTLPVPSPDGRRLLYLRLQGIGASYGEIYLYDLERHTDTRLTFTDNEAGTPVWSPDGRRFAYVVTNPVRSVIHVASADGLGAQDSIPYPFGTASVTEWLADGRLLTFDSRGRVRTIPATPGAGASATAGDSTQAMVLPRVSPDGRWLAYTRIISGIPQVYVQSFKGPPGQWQISTAPAYLPRWTKGGRELVYESQDGNVMAVDIDTSSGFRPGQPHPLFHLPMGSRNANSISWNCDASGERFYLVQPNESGAGHTVVELVTHFENLVSRK